MSEPPMDKSLFESPYADSEARSRGRVVLAAALGAVAVTTLIVFAATRSAEDPDLAAAATTLGTPASTSSSIVGAPAVWLAPYESEPRFLHHPTMLPAGWQLCRILDDASQGDRFCSGTDTDEWVQVAIRGQPFMQGRVENALPTGDERGGVWLSQGDTNELAYAVEGQFVVVMNKSGLPLDMLVEIATSIPFVSDRSSLYGDYEVPVDFNGVPPEDLAALLSEFGGEPSVQQWAGSGIQVTTPTVQLFCYPGDGWTVPWSAMNIPLPRLVPASRPIVVGDTVNGERGYALWDQAGHGCRIEGQISGDEAAEAARRIIEEIAVLTAATG